MANKTIPQLDFCLVFDGSIQFEIDNIGLSERLSLNQIVEFLNIKYAPTGSTTNLFPIPNGVNSVTVTGLGLSLNVSGVVCSVMAPNSNSLNLFGTPDISTFTTDGFKVNLSGVTDSANYVLAYTTK